MEAPTVVNIDPEGDVYLVLSDKKLLVSSKILSLVSNVFKVLLGPQFLEGSAVSPANPGSVSLLDDDSSALLAMCKVIHHSYDFPIPQPEPDFLVRVAIVSDKYNCSKAMSPWSSIRLRFLIQNATNNMDDGKLLFATYILDDAHGFRDVTKRMVYAPSERSMMNKFGPEPYGIADNIWDMLPRGMIKTIVGKELHLKKLLFGGLEYGVKCTKPLNSKLEKSPHHDGYFQSECDCLQISSAIRQLSKLKLYPLSIACDKYNVGDVLHLLEVWLSEKSTDSGNVENINTLDCSRCKRDFTGGLRFHCQTIREKIPGLCLDCVKRREIHMPEEARCRIPHIGYLGLASEYSKAAPTDTSLRAFAVKDIWPLGRH